MGLIKQAVSKMEPPSQSAVQCKKKNGLLGRIVGNSPYDCLVSTFQDILAEAQCEKGLLLYPGEEYYQVLIQTGFDFTSCVRMMPEIMMMDDMCRDSDTWKVFSGSNLKLFAPWLSTRERASLDTIALHPLHVHDQTFRIVLTESRLSMGRTPLTLSAIDLEPLETVLKKNTALVSALSVRDIPAEHTATGQEKMTAAFGERRTALLVSVSFSRLFPDPVQIETDFTRNVLYRALANRIIRQAGPASIVRRDHEYTLRIIIFAAQGTDPDLYIYQMKKALERHFGATRVARLDFSSFGTSQNPEYTRDFLNGVH